MTSRNLSGRLARLEQHVDPDKQLKISTHVTFVELVDDDDPRCGTSTIPKQEIRGNSTVTTTTSYWPRRYSD